MLEIRDATVEDLEAITELANALIPTTTYTWREALETLDERAEWFAAREASGSPVLVATIDGEVVGWASYGDFRDTKRMPGYRFTVEHTVHVRAGRWGHGIGRALVVALVDRARQAGMRVMVAAVDSSNVGSIEFHARMGFVEVGRMPRVAVKWDQPLDLVLMQLELGVDGN